MNKIPQELFDHVCSFVERDDLKNALLVSRRFQHAAERASGAFACFAFRDNDPKERENFLATFNTHRSRYLRKIVIYTNFPALVPRMHENTRQGKKKKRDRSPKPEPGPCRESTKALQEKDKMFTDQVAKAFEAIRMVEDA